MARASKGARRITVDGVAYRWRASGNDQFIGIAIWPAEHSTATLTAMVGYDEESSERNIRGGRHPMGQIVVTNRIIRRVINWARSTQRYDPASPVARMDLGRIDDAIDLTDAVHANDKWW